MIDSGGGGKLPNANCDYQTTKWKISKLPNENIQTYQLQMINSGGGGKLPNANCDLIF